MMIKHSNCEVDEVQILTNLYIFTCEASFTESIFIAERLWSLVTKNFVKLVKNKVKNFFKIVYVNCSFSLNNNLKLSLLETFFIIGYFWVV